MKILVLLFIFSLSSCAKFSYMSEQAFGHISLEYHGKNNSELLDDPKVDLEIKRKILLVQKAKKFFYEYFELESTPIYDETTILDQEAVTYLVIHSKKTKIKAIKTSIPFVGTFPYLGFFKKNSALEFAKKKQDQGYVTYVRPVYAYSTLNHPAIPFHDNILSSFFRYKDPDLIGTIFHELVHTVVFIDGEVQFNENLAQFISDELMKVYYKKNPDYSEQKKTKLENQRILMDKIVNLSEQLNSRYRNEREDPGIILKDFLTTTFYPQMNSLCLKLKVQDSCWAVKGEWNNARFAALKTYESKRDELGEVYRESALSLKDFLIKIVKHEETFDRSKPFLESLKIKDK